MPLDVFDAIQAIEFIGKAVMDAQKEKKKQADAIAPPLPPRNVTGTTRLAKNAHLRPVQSPLDKPVEAATACPAAEAYVREDHVTRVATTTVVSPSVSTTNRRSLNRRHLRQAMIHKEILDKPLSLR